jgi:hypothetical protein
VWGSVGSFILRKGIITIKREREREREREGV